jgi:predicted ATPase
MALKGWAAQEVWDSLQLALRLAHSLHRNDALGPILWGLHAHVINSGRVAESVRWVAQLMDAANACGDPDLLILRHYAAVSANIWLGNLIKAREHADRMLVLYREERQAHLAGILNHDPKTMTLIFLARSTWMLGYPEQAARITDTAHSHARQVGHPFDLGWALSAGPLVFDFLREPDEWLKRIEEADRVGRENSLLYVTECMVPLSSGTALIRKGQVAEGIASLERGLAIWEESGGRLGSPYYKSVLADGMAQTGVLDSALHLIDEAIAQIERPGWEERWHYAEALRIKGWLLALQGHPAAVERAYIASLDWARTQQAKSWELRTATSYARLMRDQGRAGEARDLLAPVYGWFTEGFRTKDLTEAKALLDDLADTAALPAGGGFAAAGAGPDAG